MSLFARVRGRLSGAQVVQLDEDPHTWPLRSSYTVPSSPLAGTGTIIPSKAEFRNAFVPLTSVVTSNESSLAYPDTSHAAVHLCLLECFRKLRQSAVDLDLASFKPPAYIEKPIPDDGLDDEPLPESAHWDMLIGLAVTRFTTWWKSIDQVFNHASAYVQHGGNKAEVQLSKNYLPPLDVLLVWYACMLDADEYGRACRSDMRLQGLCFPWPAVRDVIDNETMSFQLPKAAENLFSTISEQSANILDYLDAPPAYTEAVAPIFNIDLVSQIHRQEKFIDASHQNLWIRSPALHGSLQRASFAYLRSQAWGKLTPDINHPLPYGVELIWRTHRLFPTQYVNYLRNADFDLSDSNSSINDLKSTKSKSKEITTTQPDATSIYAQSLQICICWTCERLRETIPTWTYHLPTKQCSPIPSNISADDLRQIQDDVSFYTQVEKARRASRFPLPTRPPTAAEKAAEKENARKQKEAGVLCGLNEYVEVLPNGKRKIRYVKAARATYGLGGMLYI